MAARKIIGYISEEDRKRLVKSYARSQVAVSGHTDMVLEEAFYFIEADIALHRELRDTYEIEPEEDVEFSVYDGAILEIEDPG